MWPGLDELAEERATVAALITIPFHVRSSEDVLARYGARASAWGHPAAAKKLRELRPIVPGAPLPGGAVAYPIHRRQEVPLWFPSHRALAFGDAVVGVDGALRVWEAADGERRTGTMGDHSLRCWHLLRCHNRRESLLKSGRRPRCAPG